MSLRSPSQGERLAFASSFATQRILKIAFDPDVIDAEPAGTVERSFILQTTAISPFVAKQKIRLFVALLRPHRKITEFKVDLVESGLLIKLFQITIRTKLIVKGLK